MCIRDRIESIQSVEEINDLISYMVQSYCQLVEQRSMSSYSDPIRQILVTKMCIRDSYLTSIYCIPIYYTSL